MIPDEAVEAAARVMFNQSRMGPLTTWEDVRVEYCGLMRASLEAAAPYMPVAGPMATGRIAIHHPDGTPKTTDEIRAEAAT